MEPQIKPSIRKQFLTKIYQRNSTSAYDIEVPEEKNENICNLNSSYGSHDADVSFESVGIAKTPDKSNKRSATPSLHHGKRNSSSHRSNNMQVFTDFLTELLNSNGNINLDISKKIQTVTKALNDNFAKNPEFSLQFYISMTGIINILNTSQDINFYELKTKIEEALSLTSGSITEIEQLTILKKHISKVSLKTITTLKRLLSPQEEILCICHAFLIFFSEADKDIEVSSNKKVPVSRVINIMQKYTLMPGKMIQTCRKVVEFIHQKLIPAACVKLSQELLSKLNEQSIIEVDRTGGIFIIYDYLKACIAYYWAYNQNCSYPVSSPIKIEKKLADFDEALEISKEILKNSTRSISPQRSKLKIASHDLRSLVTQNTIVSKSESTKSFHIKDSYEAALEERFKEFLRPKVLNDFSSLVSRIQLIDQFEREIRDEIRLRFLSRVVEEKSFEEELRKAKLE